MPTRCELIGKAKEKGLKGYSKMKKAELQALVEGGKAETPKKEKKTYAFKKKEAPKPEPLKASGTARRVKAKDTEAGKAQAKQVSSFMGKVKEGRDKRVRGTKDVKPKSKPARGDYGLAPPTAAFVVPPPFPTSHVDVLNRRYSKNVLIADSSRGGGAEPTASVLKQLNEQHSQLLPSPNPLGKNSRDLLNSQIEWVKKYHKVDGPEDGNPIYEPTHDEALDYANEVTKFGIASRMMRGKAYAKSIAEKKQRLRDHPVGQWAARNPTAMKLKLRL